MNKNIFLFALVLLSTLTFMSAQANFIFQQDTEIDLKIACFDENNNLCNSSVTCNITILRPNHQVIINNQEMTFNTAFYNITLNTTDTSVLGEHSSIGVCTGTTTGFSTFTFEVTPSGDVLSTSEGIVYLIFIIVALILLSVLLTASFMIPFAHPRTMEGQISSINNTRWIKISAIVLSYVTTMWLFGLMNQLTRNYLFLEAPGEFFFYLYYVMLSLLFPLVIISAFILILDFLRRKELLNELKRNIKGGFGKR